MRLLCHMAQNGISQAVISDLGDGWLAFPDKDTLVTANRRLRQAVSESDGQWNTINVYDILNCDTLIVAQGAVAKIEEVYAR